MVSGVRGYWSTCVLVYMVLVYMCTGLHGTGLHGTGLHGTGLHGYILVSFYFRQSIQYGL